MIDKLTDEQIAKFDYYVKEGIRKGLSTEPVEDLEIYEAVKLLYEKGGLIVPEKIYIVDSPHKAQLLANFLKTDPSEEEIQKVKDDSFANIPKFEKSEYFSMVWGSFEYSWLIFYEFFRNEFPEKFKMIDDLDGLFACTKTGGVIPFDVCAIISRKPIAINLDADGKLHCGFGPALEYTDGYSVWALHGVRVNRRTVMEIESFSPQEILTESNIEIRRAMIDHYGQDKLIKQSGAKTIHRDLDKLGNPMEILNVDIGELEPINMLFVHDPAKGAYKGKLETGIRVPPSIKDVHEAKAWTFGKTTEEFNPDIEV